MLTALYLSHVLDRLCMVLRMKVDSHETTKTMHCIEQHALHTEAHPPNSQHPSFVPHPETD